MRTTLSIHSYFTLLLVGIMLPFLVFSALLVNQAASDEQELMARTLRNAADGASNDVNRQLGNLMALVLALADARPLQTADLAAFYEVAGELVRRQDLSAVLYDPSGQQLLNTAVPFGAPLPSDPSTVRTVVENGVPEISDLIRDPLTGAWTVHIAVPVLRDGALVYVLTLGIARAIAENLLQQIVLPEQNVGLIDRQGTIIYRTALASQVVGLKAPSTFLNQIAGQQQGSFASQSRAGVPVQIAFSRVKLAGWVLGVSIPRHVLLAPAYHSQLRLLVLGAATLLLAGLVAWTMGRAIARPMTELSRLASALGSGTSLPAPPTTRVREITAVATAMLAEARQLREQTEQRERAARALQAEINSRQSIEQQLMQSQKMEAIGQLTGGLAHDFNNLLAIIIGNLDALRERWNDDRESSELADAALEAALRGADLTRQMLAFARRQPLAPEQCDINRVIRTITRLLRRTLGEDIVIQLQLAPEVWPVMVDRAQLGAAITNLATNARDAMPDGGRVSISTRNTGLDEEYVSSHADVAAGDYVLIEVSDNGIGMSPMVLARIFEPFFTTKGPGRGTGLGLSMVFGFMKQSGGHVCAYSEVAQGTTFRLYLPRVAAGASEDTAVVTTAPEPGHNETILAVEDSHRLRQILARQLSSAGYHVLEASNAQAALELIERDASIDLLLTDVVMPGGMNGQELARAAVQQRPHLKTLLTTGFSDVTDGDGMTEQRILRKPYRKDDLLRMVRNVLDC